MHHGDVEPGGVVGYKKDRIRQWRAETTAAEAEDTKQQDRPQPDRTVGERLAAVLHHAAGPAQHEGADQDGEHDMQQHQRDSP